MCIVQYDSIAMAAGGNPNIWSPRTYDRPNIWSPMFPSRITFGRNCQEQNFWYRKSQKSGQLSFQGFQNWRSGLTGDPLGGSKSHAEFLEIPLAIRKNSAKSRSIPHLDLVQLPHAYVIRALESSLMRFSHMHTKNLCKFLQHSWQPWSCFPSHRHGKRSDLAV